MADSGEAATHQPTNNTLPQCSMINVTDSDSVVDDSSKARIATCNDAMYAAVKEVGGDEG